MIFLRESTHTLLNFADQMVIGTGGEARICAVPGEPELVAKIYHQPAAEHAAKLAAMLANPPFDANDQQMRAAIVWPLEHLRKPDHSRQVAGFLMPRLHAMRPVMDFYNPRARRTAAPLFTYQYLHRTARNLAAAFKQLHERGYVIGDVNESNVLVSPTALVTLVDTDSFQVRDPQSGAVYRCPVGKAEFTPPELHNARFAEIERTPEHDRFGLAVLLFQLLMEGTHPFAGVYTGPGEPPLIEARITAGHFAFGLGRQVPYRPMPLAPPFELLAPALRQLFVQAFVTGHALPQVRPSAQQWADALKEAESTLHACAQNPQHQFGIHLAVCPWCERARKLNGRDPFPSPTAIQRGEHLRLAPRRATLQSLPPSPYYITTAGSSIAGSTMSSTSRTYGVSAYGATRYPVYVVNPNAPPPMTYFLQNNAPQPQYWWTRWLQIGQRVMALFLALVLLALSFAGFDNAPRVTVTPTKPMPRSASAYWKEMLQTNQQRVRGVSLNRDGQMHALVTNEKQFTLLPFGPGKSGTKPARTFSNPQAESLTAAALSPDGSLAVTGGTDNTLSFWDVATGALRFSVRTNKRTVSALAFAPDGMTLASSYSDYTVMLWDPLLGQLKHNFMIHYDWVLALAFRSDGKMMASAGADQKVYLYDSTEAGEWTHTRTLLNSREDICALAFSGDGKRLAAANLAGEILWWDTEQGALHQTISLNNEIALSLAFSPNGRLLAVGTADNSGEGSLRVLNEAGTQLYERRGHAGPVRAVAFDSNGTELTSAGNVIRVWETATGAAVRTVNLQP